MMVRDAEATRQRLIAAAQTEFATYGIAGARVDRIALSAGSNKAQIYHYFGNKDLLYDAVWENLVRRTVTETTIDTSDLAGYAAELTGLYDANPEYARLIAWQRLERSNGPSLPLSIEHISKHVQAIAQAQAEGSVTDRFTPGMIYSLILHVATMWLDMSPDVKIVVGDVEDPARRAFVSKAIATLLEPIPAAAAKD